MQGSKKRAELNGRPTPNHEYEPPDNRYTLQVKRFIAAIEGCVLKHGGRISSSEIKRRLQATGEWIDQPPFLDVIGLCENIEDVPGEPRLLYQPKGWRLVHPQTYNGDPRRVKREVVNDG